ncbi:carbohydrate ABC transporter permease [Salinibacterium sp. PAMC 21357]|uniref:carbohydrate ABC transporter permease n=1 Tax=Salinibacterium sp. PAMC 21357 TaxID=1112215 RepID=UPI000289933D|nr:sugar ABC transporter permease [Salinibacterium sp. PAMC 21357]
MTALSTEPVTATLKTGSARKVRRPGDGRWAAVFLGPWAIGLVLLTIGPMMASLYLAFTDYDLLTTPTWTGFDNFTRMFTDPLWQKAMTVTIMYVAVSVPFQLAFALMLALALNKGVWGVGFFRSVYYIPSLVGTSVAIAILWRQVFGSAGLFNQGLGLLGIESTTSWIGDSSTALWTLILLRVWEFGAPMVIFLAGLRQIPTELYESASLDGAGPWRQFWKITMPLLTPVLFFNLVLQIINAFQVFGSAYIIGGNGGGPANSLLLYSVYLYQAAFANFEMGYAAAMAWVLLILIGVVTALNFWVGRFWITYSDD